MVLSKYERPKGIDSNTLWDKSQLLLWPANAYNGHKKLTLFTRKLTNREEQHESGYPTLDAEWLSQRVNNKDDDEYFVGSGAFANVYEVPDTNPQLVVKHYSKFTGVFKTLIENEISVLKTLKHKNVVKQFGCVRNEKKEIIGLIMPKMENTLLDYIHSPIYTYTILTVLGWMEQLVNVLEYLRKARHVHRDIKPDNILVDSNGFLILGDFGSSKDTVGSGSFDVGNLRYKAFELFPSESKSAQYTHDSDLYAVGIVCVEIIERRRCFRQFMRQEYDAKQQKMVDVDFDRDTFLNEYEKCGNVSDVEPMQGLAVQGIREMISSWTNFTSTERRKEEHLWLLPCMKVLYEYLGRWSFRPVEDPNETNLYKPRGFNHKDDHVIVGTKEEDLMGEEFGFLSLGAKKAKGESRRRGSIDSESEKECEIDNLALALKDGYLLVLKETQVEPGVLGFNEWSDFVDKLKQKTINKIKTSLSIPSLCAIWQKELMRCLLRDLRPIVVAQSKKNLQQHFHSPLKEFSCFQSEKTSQHVILLDLPSHYGEYRFWSHEVINIVKETGRWDESSKIFVTENDDVLRYTQLFDEHWIYERFLPTNLSLRDLFDGSRIEVDDLKIEPFIFQLTQPPIYSCTCVQKCHMHDEILIFGNPKLQNRLPSCCGSYPEYLALFFECVSFLLGLEHLKDFFDLAIVLNRLFYLKTLLEKTRCQKLFPVYKVKSSENKSLIVLHWAEKESKIVIFDEDLLSITEKEITFVELKNGEISSLDLTTLIDLVTAERIFGNFITGYSQRSESCAFLKSVGKNVEDVLDHQETLWRLVDDWFSGRLDSLISEDECMRERRENDFEMRLPTTLLQLWLCSLTQDGAPIESFRKIWIDGQKTAKAKRFELLWALEGFCERCTSSCQSL
ncbi:unnamed protein product, partial [Mesorhabditis belari]|uniref:Protein kinase domain-containing protein n=1 Tax=Mesorhabditis belari TaxID=2138241 RepID=A0AAF3FIY9_9BILA